jgi:hypothetical protein
MNTLPPPKSILQHCIAACVAILFTVLIAHRIWRYATFEVEQASMPAPVADAEESDLFRTPLGKYSSADIVANGPLLPSQKYRGFRAQHDFNPQPGDRLCPVTRTKANPSCTWIVGGESYEFCCPPCIAEFVRSAKEAPTRLSPAEDYVVPQSLTANSP